MLKIGINPRARDRWYQNLSLDNYDIVSRPIPVLSISGEDGFLLPSKQQVLRMMVRRPGQGCMLPAELKWLGRPLQVAIERQQSFGLYQDRYVYITVRIGEVSTTTDDVWHVDGFGMREVHLPEQNYVWCDHTPTEYLDQDIPVPSGFDPMAHNIHTFFQERADLSCVRSLDAGCMYLIDPYCIHRRPPSTNNSIHRSFFRISFVPVEIKDNTCQQNPLLPSGPYAQEDIRKKLTRYIADISV